MLRLLLGGIVLVSSLAHARAGICLEDVEWENEVKQLETFAKGGKKDPEIYCVRIDPKPALAKRVIAACSKILARAPKNALCIELAARNGQKELGGVKIYEELSTLKMQPFEYIPFGALTTAYAPLGDPRGADHLIAIWKATEAEPTTKTRIKNKNTAFNWGRWRRDAAAGIGVLGDLDDQAFLDQQATSADDKFVRKACAKASKKITKRLAASGAPQ